MSDIEHERPCSLNYPCMKDETNCSRRQPCRGHVKVAPKQVNDLVSLLLLPSELETMLAVLNADGTLATLLDLVHRKPALRDQVLSAVRARQELDRSAGLPQAHPEADPFRGYNPWVAVPRRITRGSKEAGASMTRGVPTSEDSEAREIMAQLVTRMNTASEERDSDEHTSDDDVMLPEFRS